PYLVGVNETVTYTITLLNNRATAAENVTLTDNLSPVLTLSGCSATGGGVCGGTGNNRIVTFASLPANGSATVTIHAPTLCSASNQDSIANTATVTSGTAGAVFGSGSVVVSSLVGARTRLDPPRLSVGADDRGVVQINVMTPSVCSWTAVSNADF